MVINISEEPTASIFREEMNVSVKNISKYRIIEKEFWNSRLQSLELLVFWTLSMVRYSKN
jgi:hypothetical protein